MKKAVVTKHFSIQVGDGMFIQCCPGLMILVSDEVFAEMGDYSNKPESVRVVKANGKLGLVEISKFEILETP